MSMYSQFKTNEQLEREGVVHDFGSFRVRLGRAGGANQRFNKLAEKFAKENSRLIANNLLSNEKAKAAMHNIYAEGVVFDWEVPIKNDENGIIEWVPGIEMPDGTIGEFNKENLIETFINLNDLFEQLVELSKTRENYSQELVDASVKN